MAKPGTQEEPTGPNPPPPPVSLEGRSEKEKKGIGGWLKSKTAELQGHAKEIRENAKTIAQDISGFGKIGTRMGEERIEVTFMQRSLGLELDLREASVRAVKPGGQAESLAVQVHDRLVAIDGEPLPQVEDEVQFIEMLKLRMSSMPRPVVLTFARACILPEEASTTVEEGEHVLDLVTKQMNKLPGSVALPVALPFGRGKDEERVEDGGGSAARELVQRYEAELQALREEAAQLREEAKAANADAIAAVEEAASLRADLADVQLSKVWSAQEVKRAQGEAEAAVASVTAVHGDVARLKEELAKCGEQQAALEKALAEEKATVEGHRQEGAVLTARAVEAAARAAELERSNEELRSQVEEARQQIRASQAERAERARLEETAAAGTEEQLQELKRLHADCAEELRDFKVREAAAKAKAAEAAAELARAREDAEQQAAKAVAAAEAAEEMRLQVQQLQSQLHTTEAEPGTSSSRGASPRRSLAPPTVLGKRGGSSSAPAAHPTEDIAVLAEPQDGADALVARIQELEERNEALSRQLSARPIIYQFSPLGADDDVVPDEEDLEGSPSGLESGYKEAGGGAEAAPPSAFAVCCAGLSFCRRKTARGLLACRKQRCSTSVEKRLRLFTRAMLRRPLLLWLFYAHVVALWVVVGFRQASTTARVSVDPAANLDKMFQAAAASQGR